jgi:predicted alpha/beta-hydrolase family hydrolase
MRIPTAAGPAEATVHGDGRFLVVLTHGAGGEPDAKDLLAVRDAAVELGGTVALVRQPYRVAGRRAPGKPGPQDAAWLEAVTALRARHPGPVILGGRSNGARVACRTARAARAAGVIALAFPLHPPGKPEQSRAEELRMADTVLVINGSRDPFGVPDATPGPGQRLRLEVIAGQAHAFRSGFDLIGDTVRDWLSRLVSRRA